MQHAMRQQDVSVGSCRQSSQDRRLLKLDFPLGLSQMKLVHFQVLFLLAQLTIQCVKFGSFLPLKAPGTALSLHQQSWGQA